MTAQRLIRIACLFACVGGAMMSAACDEVPRSPVSPSSSSSNSSWELSGVAIGEDVKLWTFTRASSDGYRPESQSR
jgi:hypothetical protein